MTNLSLNSGFYSMKNHWKFEKFKSKRILEIEKVGTKTNKKVNIPSKRDKNVMLNAFQNQFKIQQNLKSFYGGLSENYFSSILSKKSGALKNSKLCYLEKRLDVILFRLGLSSSIWESRKLILSNLILLNDKIILNTNYTKILKVGDKISINWDKFPKEAIENKNSVFLAKIKHLKYNLFAYNEAFPTHLLFQFSSSTVGGGGCQFEGYLIKEPIESEIYLPYNSNI